MRMDNTRIAVRERGILEILDLSLHLTRFYVQPLAITLALGIAPLMLLNQLLIGWMADVDWEVEFPFRYVWNMLCLVVIEAPLVSVFATTYLGLSVFHDKPGVWRVVKDVFRLSPRLAFTQLLVRGIGPAWLLYLVVSRNGEMGYVVDAFFIPCIVMYTLVVRAVRPFINEIVLLEKNPLRARSGESLRRRPHESQGEFLERLKSQDANTMTIGRRSKFLHSPSGSELFARWVLASTIAVLMFGAFYATFHLASSMFLGDPTQGAWMIELVMPLTMWLVAGYFTVVRFLSYLDLRIRQEGWEVELRLRSEAAILQSRMT